MTPAPTSYDFRRPSRLGREQTRALRLVNESFARESALLLTTTLHASVHVTVESIRQISCGEYVRTLSNPSLLAVLSLGPLPGSAVLQLPMGIVMGIVDRLLGGPGGPNQPNRALSDIETDLVRRLLQRVAGGLTQAFEPLTWVRAEVAGLESDPQMLNVAPPSAPVVVADFVIRLAEVHAECTLCIPFATLKPALEGVTSRPAPVGADRDDAAALAVEDRLYDVPVDVRVAFRPVTLTSSEVLALAVDDVLPLCHAIDTPLSVTAEGVTVASAVPGSHGRRLACQVVSA